jgi:hypothetical protein
VQGTLGKIAGVALHTTDPGARRGQQTEAARNIVGFADCEATGTGPVGRLWVGHQPVALMGRVEGQPCIVRTLNVQSNAGLERWHRVWALMWTSAKAQRTIAARQRKPTSLQFRLDVDHELDLIITQDDVT